MAKRGFNFWFGAFILAGMAAAVGYVNFSTLGNPGVQVTKQLVITLGALCGVAASVLSAGGSIWNFVFGLIGICVTAYANLDSGNIGQFAEHVLYFLPMQFVGWWQWTRRGADARTDTKVKGRRLSPAQWAAVAAGIVAGTALLYAALLWFDTRSFDAGKIAGIDRSKIFLDALLVSLNVSGQILLSLAYAEQWWIWICVNLCSVMLWTNRMLAPGAGSYTLVMVIKYSLMLLNALNGLRLWLKMSRAGRVE